ncbi:MAG: hypothetical protein J0L76_11895 [Rhodobacterales bacterium]|nr:hypothetical protein [Rhodobacterales bacterium]
MLKRVLLLAALIALPAQADDALVLAEYWTDSGSLPPEYAWTTSITILEDGQLTLKHCKGYDSEGPACKTRRATVPEPALTAIRTAAEESGLAAKPAKEAEFPMVGGGLTGGRVYVGGQQVVLLAQPADADADRVGRVLEAIAAALPPRFAHFINPD